MRAEVNHSTLIVSRDGDTIEAILPMPLPYLPVPPGLSGDLSAIIVVPIYLLCSFVYRKLRGIQPPPRARFVITPLLFQMEFVSPETGESTRLECDPANIVEFRKNQYSKGLYVHVSKQIIHTYMEDFDDATVSSIAEDVRDLINSTLNLSINAEPTRSLDK